MQTERKIKSRITVAGHEFAMPEERGYGVVPLDGRLTLIEFSSPFETCPPQGEGAIIGQAFQLSVKGGVAYWDGQPVCFPVE